MKRTYLLLVLGLVLLSFFALTAAPADANVGIKRMKIMSIAQGELKKGVKETNGDNMPRDRKGRLRPYATGVPWCSTFTSWVWKKAGMRQAVKNIAVNKRVRSVYNWARRNGKLTKKVGGGDLAIWRGFRHIGIIIGAKNGRFLVISGNSNDRVRSHWVPFKRILAVVSVG
jgi:hypothetical protein